MLIARGYGVRRLGETELRWIPMTQFGIASNTQALHGDGARAAGRGENLNGMSRSSGYLPGSDVGPLTSRGSSPIRDLLVHRSGLGLGAGDLLWWPASTYDREEIAQRLRLHPARDLVSERVRLRQRAVPRGGRGHRGGERAGPGKISWAGGFSPGRNDRQRRAALRRGKGGNVAATHAPIEGTVRPIAPFHSDNAESGRRHHSGADDMARWMRVQLASGRTAERLVALRRHPTGAN